MARTCVFCDSPLIGQAASSEHVIPLWLQDTLGISSEEIQITLTRVYDQEITNQRNSHPLSSLVAGTVCRSCNNGWMSSLESVVKEPLLQIIRNEKQLSDLSVRNREIIAYWAAKTAFVLDSILFERRVPPEHFRALLRGNLPPGVTIFAHQHEPTRRVWLHSSADWSTEGGASYAEAMFIVRAAYKIAIQLDNLILLVTYWPFAEWHLRVIAGVHHVLAGTHHDVAQWDLRWPFPLLTESRTILLSDSVGAVRDDGRTYA